MAEVHVLSYETPIAAYIRKLMCENPSVSQKIFGTRTLAALMQFDPTSRYIEEEKGEIVISALRGLPLVRYVSHDLGGVIRSGEMLDFMKAECFDILEVLEKEGYPPESVWRWPFFYSSGRGDSVSLMSANIYPANIEHYFHGHQDLSDYKIGVEHDTAEKPRFCVYLELREGKDWGMGEKRAFERKAQKALLQVLLEQNMDFADAYKEEPTIMLPKVILKDYKEVPFENKKIKQTHIFK